MRRPWPTGGLSRQKKKNQMKKIKVKYKVRPRTGHEGPERKYRYSCTPSITSALDGGEKSTPRTHRFTREEKSCVSCVRDSTHPMAVLDGCGKSLPHGDSIPGPYSP
jgi:hypothetical protein